MKRFVFVSSALVLSALLSPLSAAAEAPRSEGDSADNGLPSASLLDLNQAPGLPDWEVIPDGAQHLIPSDEGRFGKDQWTESEPASGTINRFKRWLGYSGGRIPLGNGSGAGDIFVAPAGLLGVEHGHVGLYIDRTTVLQTDGPGTKSRLFSANEVLVSPGTVKQRVQVSAQSKRQVVNYAKEHLVGLGYSINFMVNRYMNTSNANCAQLVWMAFKQGAKIDIDGTRSSSVWPLAIRDSPWTRTYEIVKRPSDAGGATAKLAKSALTAANSPLAAGAAA